MNAENVQTLAAQVITHDSPIAAFRNLAALPMPIGTRTSGTYRT